MEAAITATNTKLSQQAEIRKKKVDLDNDQILLCAFEHSPT